MLQTSSFAYLETGLHLPETSLIFCKAFLLLLQFLIQSLFCRDYGRRQSSQQKDNIKAKRYFIVLHGGYEESMCCREFSTAYLSCSPAFLGSI